MNEKWSPGVLIEYLPGPFSVNDGCGGENMYIIK
jgi:hypothetical protein